VVARRFLFFLFILFGAVPAVAQRAIVGALKDGMTGAPLAGVRIENIHTRARFTTDSSGAFRVEAGPDQLLEFRVPGYQVLRLRIPRGEPAGYYALQMNRSTIDIAEVEIRDRNLDYRKDSVRDRETYARALDFPTMTAMDVLNHPFSAISRTNRRTWAFQREYAVHQQEKFVDFMFNPRVIRDLTGLSGEAARRYMARYRPTYEQLRAWSEYDFYAYVKRTGAQFAARGGR